MGRVVFCADFFGDGGNSGFFFGGYVFLDELDVLLYRFFQSCD